MLKRNMISAAGCLLLFAATLFTGCSGGGGGGTPAPTPTPSKPVVDAASMTTDQLSKVSLQATDFKVTINSPPVVTFKLLTADGSPIKGLGVKSPATSTNPNPTTLNYMRFTIAKLVPGTNGSSDQWQNYLVTATSRPTTENVAAGMVDNGDGSYTYTFTKNITDPTQTNNVTYQPSMTHRLAIQISGTIPGTTTTLANPANIIYDFVPDGSKVTTTKEVTLIAKCNECHEKLTFHGSRFEAKYCVVCHTDQRKIGRTNSASSNGVFTGTTFVADGEVQGDFGIMVHKIHMGSRLTKTGYDYDGVKYNDIVYSIIDGQNNCKKCHTKSDAAPQGDNWMAKPSRASCGSCHDNLNFATGANMKTGGAVHIIQTNDANCATCHTATKIKEAHASDNNTPNATMQKAGLVNFTYEIKNVSVSADNQPVVTFRILKDGTAVAFDGSGANPLKGFTGSPGFLISYALPQGGVTPVDYNNLGKSAAQPATVNIDKLLDGTQGTLAGPDASGYYTATINGASNAGRFPAGATLRAVGLQGYFTQAAGTGGIATATGRHATSVIKEVTGDQVRRTVVDSAKCSKCHEFFEGHGGSRNYNIQICVTCHNPNLTSGGRTASAAAPAAEQAKMNEFKAAYLAKFKKEYPLDPTNPATYPESSNNLKDMIHGIHAGSKRFNDDAPYVFVRNRSGGLFYDWRKVTFPGVLKNCESCHVPGTYSNTPANVLVSTYVTLGAGTVAQNRASLPNTTDNIIPAFTSTCISCHGSANSGAHSVQMGGTTLAGQLRSTAVAENCAACHSAGKTLDAALVHKR